MTRGFNMQINLSSPLLHLGGSSAQRQLEEVCCLRALARFAVCSALLSFVLCYRVEASPTHLHLPGRA